MSPKWLSTLVKARQAQEDQAQYELASAERRARAAHLATRRANAKVDELVEVAGPDATMTASAFVASAAALQSAAANHAIAVFAAEQADLGAGHRLDYLRRAATDRGAAENLHDAQLETERKHSERIAQRDMDEAAARVHRDSRRRDDAKRATS
jgi:hypothetical protein